MDANGYSDPYLKVKLGGKTIHNDRRSYLAKTLHCDWYKCIPLTVTVPGDGKVRIEVWDHDRFSGDDLIGRTSIDLEDRYRWGRRVGDKSGRWRVEGEGRVGVVWGDDAHQAKVCV